MLASWTSFVGGKARKGGIHDDIQAMLMMAAGIDIMPNIEKRSAVLQTIQAPHLLPDEYGQACEKAGWRVRLPVGYAPRQSGSAAPGFAQLLPAHRDQQRP